MMMSTISCGNVHPISSDASVEGDATSRCRTKGVEVLLAIARTLDTNRNQCMRWHHKINPLGSNAPNPGGIF